MRTCRTPAAGRPCTPCAGGQPVLLGRDDTPEPASTQPRPVGLRAVRLIGQHPGTNPAGDTKFGSSKHRRHRSKRVRVASQRCPSGLRSRSCRKSRSSTRASASSRYGHTTRSNQAQRTELWSDAHCYRMLASVLRCARPSDRIAICRQRWPTPFVVLPAVEGRSICERLPRPPPPSTPHRRD